MLIYDDFNKKRHLIFKKLLLLFWKFLSYLVCVPSFKSYFKKYDRDNFTFNPHKQLPDQNMSVGIGLMEVTEPSDTLNYMSFFKYCILQTILHIFLLFIFEWNKISCSKNWAVHFFDLVWICIQCYSIEGSVFLVLFL